jgi:hypothetical protein
MKMKLILICFFVVLLGSSEAQPYIQGTIKSGPASNQVELWLKPNFSNSTQFLFQIGFPVAYPASTSPAPTALLVTLDPGFITSFGNTYSITVDNGGTGGAGNVDKYFKIVLIRQPGSGGAGSMPQTWTAGVEFKVLTATFQGSTASAFVKLADYQDGGSDAGGQFYTQDGSNNYYLNSTSNLNFYSAPGATGSTVGGDALYGFTQTNSLISLPVNLLNFSGYKDGSKNTLRWTTANEENNRGFAVQRSLNGSSYEDIGFVNSLAPGGSSSASISYTFDDINPVGRKQYYRLRQVDVDNKSKLSNIISITGDKPTILGIGGLFPNPASTQVNVIIDAPKRDKITVVVTDMAGKTVIRQQANVDTGSNTVPVDIAKLAGGSYLVKLTCQSSDCQTATGKFNKQ